MNSQSENNTQQNSAMDMLRKKNTRTLSELEQLSGGEWIDVCKLPA